MTEHGARSCARTDWRRTDRRVSSHLTISVQHARSGPFDVTVVTTSQQPGPAATRGRRAGRRPVVGAVVGARCAATRHAVIGRRWGPCPDRSRARFGEWPYGPHKRDPDAPNDEELGPNPYLPCEEAAPEVRLAPGGLPGTLALLAGLVGLGPRAVPDHRDRGLAVDDHRDRPGCRGPATDPRRVGPQLRRRRDAVSCCPRPASHSASRGCRCTRWPGSARRTTRAPTRTRYPTASGRARATVGPCSTIDCCSAPGRPTRIRRPPRR